jgi:EmrB/QacA subfamily drug resistance transporter
MPLSNHTSSSGSAPLTAGRRKLVLWICCMSVLIVGIDQTIVNVALPSIQRGLHASLSSLQWTVAAYTLTVACLLMLSASWADRFGRRRVFQIGLALFATGSLLCSLAPDAGWLVLFRVMQAAGGSALNPVALAIISNTMADDAERARAFGLWGAIIGVGLAAGPVVGGVLVHTIGWRSIFWLNVPIGVIAIVLTQRFVPESRADRARRPDPPAQLLLFISIGTLTTAIIEGQVKGWGAPLIIVLFVIALTAAVALVLVERRRREPLLDSRFFRSAPFSGATLIAVASFGALAGFLFINTLYLQTARGEDALNAGLLTLPMAAMIVIFAQVSGRLVARYGARLPFMLAGPAMAVGTLLLITLHSHTSIVYLFVAYVLFGVGMGLVNAPISNTAVSGMPRAQAGVAAAVASTGRQVGATLGVAVAGSLVAGSTGATFADASHSAWIFLAGCGVFVLIAGLASTSRWAQRTATQAARLIVEADTP